MVPDLEERALELSSLYTGLVMNIIQSICIRDRFSINYEYTKYVNCEKNNEVENESMHQRVQSNAFH